MDLFKAIDWNTIYMVKAILAGAGVACGAMLYVARRHSLSNVRRVTLAVLSCVALLSLLAYHDLGRLHWGKVINVYDTYHYYMGSKYYAELGYWYLYEATIIAGDEDELRAVQLAPEYRDQRSYRIRPRGRAYDSMALWRHRFTDARWREFKRDLRFFVPRTSTRAWRRMLTDKGYNPSPVWTILGHAIASHVPAREGPGMFIICHLDVVCIAVMLCGFWVAFGVETALLSAVFLGVNYSTRYGSVGGAFLRWDYCMWLVLAICAMRMRYPFLAGCFLAYASMLRIQPLVCVLAVAIVTGHAVVRLLLLRKGRRSSREVTPAISGSVEDGADRREPAFRRRWPLSRLLCRTPRRVAAGRQCCVGFILGSAVLVCVSLLTVPTGGTAWGEWFEKMTLHRQSFGTLRYGMRYLFTYENETTREDLRLDEGGWPQYDERKRERLNRLAWAQLLSQAAFLCGAAVAMRRLRHWEAMSLAPILIFALFSPTRYYYAQWITLVPLLTHQWRNAGRFTGFAVLLTAMIVAFVLETVCSLKVFIQYEVSVLFLAVCIYLVSWFVQEKIRFSPSREARQE